MSVSTDTLVAKFAGLKATTGGVTSVTLKVPDVELIAFPELSSTDSIDTNTTSPLIKSLSGLIVITFFVPSIVAEKATGIPSYAYSRVIKSPTLEFVIAVSSTFLIASENVSVTLDSMGIPVAVSAGSKFTLGAVASAVVNVDDDKLIALSHSSSTVAPIAT